MHEEIFLGPRRDWRGCRKTLTVAQAEARVTCDEAGIPSMRVVMVIASEQED